MAASRAHEVKGAFAFLAACGGLGAAQLAALLQHDLEEVRWSAVKELGDMPEGHTYAAEMIVLLGDLDPGVRQQALAALTALDDPELGRACGPLLKDPHPHLRAQACESLFTLEACAGFGSELCELLVRDPDPRVRKAALKCAKELPQAATVCAKFLWSDAGPTRTAAVGALCALPGGPRELARLLRGQSAYQRWAACSALGQVGESGHEREVARLCADEDANVRWAACATLGKLGARPASAHACRARTPRLAVQRCLRDENQEVRRAALAALPHLQPAPRSEHAEQVFAEDLGDCEADLAFATTSSAIRRVLDDPGLPFLCR